MSKRFPNSWKISTSGTPAPLEHDEQTAFFDYVRQRANNDQRYKAIWANTNAGKRSFTALQYYKDEGLEPGVLDVSIAYAAGKYHGAYIEFKRVGERLRDNQKVWVRLLSANGYAVSVHYTATTAIAWLERYFAGKLGDGEATTQGPK